MKGFIVPERFVWLRVLGSGVQDSCVFLGAVSGGHTFVSRTGEARCRTPKASNSKP